MPASACLCSFAWSQPQRPQPERNPAANNIPLINEAQAVPISTHKKPSSSISISPAGCSSCYPSTLVVGFFSASEYPLHRFGSDGSRRPFPTSHHRLQGQSRFIPPRFRTSQRFSSRWPPKLDFAPRFTPACSRDQAPAMSAEPNSSSVPLRSALKSEDDGGKTPPASGSLKGMICSTECDSACMQPRI